MNCFPKASFRLGDFYIVRFAADRARKNIDKINKTLYNQIRDIPTHRTIAGDLTVAIPELGMVGGAVAGGYLLGLYVFVEICMI